MYWKYVVYPVYTWVQQLKYFFFLSKFIETLTAHDLVDLVEHFQPKLNHSFFLHSPHSKWWPWPLMTNEMMTMMMNSHHYTPLINDLRCICVLSHRFFFSLFLLYLANFKLRIQDPQDHNNNEWPPPAHLRVNTHQITTTNGQQQHHKPTPPGIKPPKTHHQ